MADYTIQKMPDDMYEDFRIICIKKKKSVKNVIVKLMSDYVKNNQKGE